MPNDHERSDASALKIMWIAITSIVLGAVMLLGLYYVFSFLKSDREAQALKGVPEEMIALRTGPPPPLLEVNPLKEAMAIRERDKQLLKTYEWVDRENGIVRIPIEKAIEILLYEQ